MKKKPILILLIILLIALTAVVGYYVFSVKDNEKNNTEVEENNKSEENNDELKEVDFNEVKYLYDNITVYNESCAEYYNYYYQDSELKVEDMSDDFKISLALYRAYVDQKMEIDMINPSPAGDIRYISVENLNDYFNNIFSSNVSYDVEKIEKDGWFKAGYPFRHVNDRFYLPGMGCQSRIRIYKEVVKTLKNSSKVEIYEKVAYLKKAEDFTIQYGEVKTLSSDVSVASFDDINQVTSDFMKPYLDKLDTYKYTFEYIDKDNAYKFVKVEKVQ